MVRRACACARPMKPWPIIPMPGDSGVIAPSSSGPRRRVRSGVRSSLRRRVEVRDGARLADGVVASEARRAPAARHGDELLELARVRVGGLDLDPLAAAVAV